jgi:glycosyltransferase involved in cell wall biosynthesis
MKKPKLFSVVIPVYNEENTVEEIVKQVLKSDTLSLKKEIIIVDDGSKDSTPKILKKLSKAHKNIKIHLKKKNEGKCSALKTGFKKSKGDIVIVQDADLEYDPADYTKMIKPFLESAADVVYGSRLVTGAPHRVLYYWHSVVNKFLTTLSNMLTNLNLTDMETGYKAFRGKIIRDLAPKLKSTRFGFEPEVTARIAKIKNIKIFEVGISYSGRTYEEGKHIGWKDGLKAVWEIIYYNLFEEDN